MGFPSVRVLYSAPEIDPITLKARSVPVLNPFDKYGRVFFFSWFGFLIAFLSWYAFPPLLTITIRNDLGMTQEQVANSNIVALIATFLMRFIAGGLCDRFGPRYVFVGIMLSGAIPTALAGLVTNSNGLIALRFFVGILGATFVPCQVWCTSFYDQNVVGTANALAGGWGNAGGGITYFVMPAIFDSLVHDRGLPSRSAWRVAYIVPFVLIASVALAMLFLCDDAPPGKWSERHLKINSAMPSPPPEEVLTIRELQASGEVSAIEKSPEPNLRNLEAHPGPPSVLQTTRSGTAIASAFREVLPVMFSPHSLALAIPYACSFGGELAINSVIGAYYSQNFPSLGQTLSGKWAAMFGLLNVLFRPIGGMFGDLIYRHTDSVWGKKLLVTFLGVIQGVFELAIGLRNPDYQPMMYGLVAALAFFMEAANGANFAVVPHVHPFSNGIVSGVVGAMGNFGGIIFAVIFRYSGTAYDRAFWILGVISVVLNLAVGWIRPMPNGHAGGR